MPDCSKCLYDKGKGTTRVSSDCYWGQYKGSKWFYANTCPYFPKWLFLIGWLHWLWHFVIIGDPNHCGFKDKM